MWVEEIVEGGWRVRVLRRVKGKMGKYNRSFFSGNHHYEHSGNQNGKNVEF